jgi:hypothetical protein
LSERYREPPDMRTAAGAILVLALAVTALAFAAAALLAS